ncbi:MAG: DUF1684 domain-containing protein [Gemmatimonadota bacterium]
MRLILLGLLIISGTLSAQVPASLVEERSAFAAWLTTAPNSPLIARAFAPIGDGIHIGPDEANVPFPGVDARIREEHGVISLSGSLGARTLPRNRLVTSGPLALFISGTPGHSVVTVYGGPRLEKVPTYFPLDRSLVFTGPMLPVSPRTIRILTIDGLETDATEVGSVAVPDGASSIRLRVYRIVDPGSEEAELTIYFRDGTSGKGSYPAGRFVTLEPVSNGNYRLDMNRARNPFCAYSSAYPCPAPWSGNTLTTRIEAGERYDHEPSSPQKQSRP